MCDNLNAQKVQEGMFSINISQKIMSRNNRNNLLFKQNLAGHE